MDHDELIGEGTRYEDAPDWRSYDDRLEASPHDDEVVAIADDLH